jgi:mannose-6-phosphate isomerase-like protein (cupin superfamily)
MKRHPSLEPFSRDHNVGLVLARRLSEQPEQANSLGEFLAAWHDELEDHFHEEERLLLPWCDPESRDRMVGDHRSIADLASRAEKEELPRDEVQRLGQLLNDHIRWEERSLFPALERDLDEAQLQAIGSDTADLEARRAGSAWSPRRGELNERRREEQLGGALKVDLLAMAEGLAAGGPAWGHESEDLDCTLLHWEQGRGVAEHVNDEVDVVMVVLEGEGEVTVDGIARGLRPGHALMIPKGLRRSVSATSDHLTYLNVHKRRRKLMPTAARPRPAP